MIAVLLSILPLLLWDEGPATAPQLKKAGIQEIAVTRDANAWSSTGITANVIDPSKITRLDSIGVDYQIGAAGATAAPWVESNLWRMIRDPGASFLYDVKPRLSPWLSLRHTPEAQERTFSLNRSTSTISPPRTDF